MVFRLTEVKWHFQQFKEDLQPPPHFICTRKLEQVIAASAALQYYMVYELSFCQ
jgi:hypothetical protein